MMKKENGKTVPPRSGGWDGNIAGCHARSGFQALETVDRRQSRPARTLARERLDGFAAGADAKAGGTDCAGPWGTLKTEYET